MKKTLLFASFLLLGCGGCFRDNGFDAGGPITRHMMGRWQLEKVVAPSGTKVGAQIGYTEILENENDGDGDYIKIYRNDSLVSFHSERRNPPPIAKARDMTAIITYDTGLKRYFKIRQDPTRSTLETSAFVSEIGSAQDSVRYHYIYLGRR